MSNHKTWQKQKYPQDKKKQLNLASVSKKMQISQMPLNKFLAHCGVTSRRDAVTLITEGKVTVNKKIITQPAFKVSEKDEMVI